jgi:PAS domain S-box-containing protein
VLAYVVVAGRILPEESDSELVAFIEKVDIAILVLFPYFLFRFASTFERRNKWLELGAALLTLAVIVAVFTTGDLPEEGEPRTGGTVILLSLLLGQWTILSAFVSVRLWRGGRGQPEVAKRRMRTLSMGAIGLALLLVIAGTRTPTEEISVFDIGVQLGALAIGPLFLLGFAPPPFVRALWRKRGTERLQTAEAQLMEALTPEDVARTLLPHVSEMSAGRGSFLVDLNDRVVGTHGLSDEEAAQALKDLGSTDAERTYQSEVVIPMKSGRMVVVSSPYTPFFGEDELGLLRRLAFLADLALERANLFQSLQGTHDRLLEAQELASIGSWEWDVRSDETTWSDELFRIFGMEPDSFTPTADSVIPMILEEDQGVMQDAISHALDEDERFDVEYRIRRPDGRVRYIHARAQTVRDEDGKVLKMIGTAQDISQRKAQEEFRDRFIANAAHELRTPMTTLVGFVQVLTKNRDRMTEKQMESALSAMSRSSQRLTVLVNNLLDISKLQAGALQLRLEPVEVNEIFQRVIEANPPPPGHKLDVETSGDLRVSSDALRLEQVLVNLVTNAYRYGGKNVTLRAENSGPHTKVSVCDDGPGVEAELVPSLFEPFARGSDSANIGGSGLGLAIVKMIVEALDGQVYYEPNEPTGASFVVRLQSA